MTDPPSKSNLVELMVHAYDRCKWGDLATWWIAMVTAGEKLALDQDVSSWEYTMREAENTRQSWLAKYQQGTIGKAKRLMSYEKGKS